MRDQPEIIATREVVKSGGGGHGGGKHHR